MTRDGCNFDLPRKNDLQEHPLADVFGAEGNPYGMASLGKNSRVNGKLAEFGMAGIMAVLQASTQKYSWRSRRGQ